jgi:hypothetical protein
MKATREKTVLVDNGFALITSSLEYQLITSGLGLGIFNSFEAFDIKVFQ